MTSKAINAIADCQIYFKCENFQKMGAFKMRGATYAALQLSPEQRSKGIVTHSSGNMAQAVSLAAKSLGIPAYIVMPENAPQVKKDAVAGYGGIITEVASNVKAREAAADIIAAEKGAHFIHPSNDMDVILGQGTAAYELLSVHDDLDYICTPVGGGGLLAGTALNGFHFGNGCKTIAGEPLNVNDAYRSLEAGVILENETSDTVADGLRTHLGDINFPIIQKYVDKIICVEEDEIVSAMRLIWERMKIIIEPSCAVPLAAILKEKAEFKNQKVGIILSGGNVDLGNLPF
jgi:threonine dehydratase